MRVVPLLVLLFCSLSVSVAPEISVATEPAGLGVTSAADASTYQALQSEADLARDILAQSQGRRIAMAQVAAD